MSINLNAIKAGGQRWWRPNLFLNGNFADDITVGAHFYTNASTFQRVQSIVGGNALPVYPVVGKYLYWLSSPADLTDPQILFLQNIPCKPQTSYTVSWWEMNANPPTIVSSGSYVYYNNGSILNLSHVPIKDNSNFHRVSVTFQTPANVTSFQLRLGLHISGTYNNNVVHLSYDGIYVCEGTETPYHWVDAINGIDTLADFVYWKSLDDQNKMLNEKWVIASANHPGIIKLGANSDFNINNSGELELNTNVFHTLNPDQALIVADSSKLTSSDSVYAYLKINKAQDVILRGTNVNWI